MRIHRFLVEIELSDTEGAITDTELVHQINKVLKLQKGEQIELFNKAGESVKALITETEEKQIDFMVLEKEKVDVEKKEVVLAAAIVKRDNFEWIVQKATEIGATEIIPLITDHSIKFGIQLHRLKRISEEAVEQCGRVTVPIVREPENFKDVLKNIGNGTKYFFDMGGKKMPAGAKKAEKLVLFVGPEGGWSENERAAAKEAGCVVISLGKTVLRAETAATIATYLAVNS